MKKDFLERLAGDALAALISHNNGSMEDSLDEMDFSDEERKEIKEWYGWDDEDDEDDDEDYSDLDDEPLDRDDPEVEKLYKVYLKEWEAGHKGPEFEGMEPADFDEWYDCEYLESFEDEEEEDD